LKPLEPLELEPLELEPLEPLERLEPPAVRERERQR
jgi:hypothetical protein